MDVAGLGIGTVQLVVRVLVVNAGSSSLKLRLLDADDVVLAGDDLSARDGDIDEALADVLSAYPTLDAVGHRIVHGGDRYREAIRLDAQALQALEALGELAPLHQARALHARTLVSAALPDVPEVACFDTAFHAAMPATAATYALPRAWRERWPLRRYGFHGLSHAYAARRAAELLSAPLDELRIVTCHLGAGASLCAVHGGRSIDTTMGFTPLEGLVMATRSGDVDPGLLLWLLADGRLEIDALACGLERESGLVGLAGSADMRTVVARAGAGDVDAQLALDVYLHRLRAGIGAMAVALEGLDALVFTGGVGENSPEIRRSAVDGLGLLGLALDHERNASSDGDADIGGPSTEARIVVVTAREDLEIARQVRNLLGTPGEARHGVVASSGCDDGP